MDASTAIVIGGGISGVIASASAVAVALINNRGAMKREERQDERQDRVARNLLESNARIAAHVAEVRDATNHLMHEALEAKGIVSHAAGVAEERARALPNQEESEK